MVMNPIISQALAEAHVAELRRTARRGTVRRGTARRGTVRRGTMARSRHGWLRRLQPRLPRRAARPLPSTACGLGR
jgi:hypothetical protein